MLRSPRRIEWLLLAGILQACTTGDADDTGAPPADEHEELPDPAAPASAELRVDLAPRQTAYAAGEPVLVDVTITNTGARPAQLLSWMLPAADLEEALFVVTYGRGRAGFVGAHYKRAAPESGDFVQLAAGASLTRHVDLARFYDLSRTGSYDVRFVADEAALRPEDGPTAAVVASTTARLWIEGRAVAAPEPTTPDEIALAGSLAFSRCSSTQQSTVTQAVSVANTMSDGALSYLSGTPTASQRYTTWFGSFSTSRWGTARSHFTAIADAFDTRPITIDCGCKKSYYAYVYPAQPVQDLRLQRVLGGAALRHRLQGRHARPRDEPLQRGRRHRRPRLRPERLQVARALEPAERPQQRRLARVLRREHAVAAVARSDALTARAASSAAARVHAARTAPRGLRPRSGPRAGPTAPAR